MEPRFGRDFSHVRVRADVDAAASARALHARAYTRGSELVFGAGEYAPASDAGRRLLAHELAHVVQQDGGGPLPAGDRLAPVASGVIQRQWIPDEEVVDSEILEAAGAATAAEVDAATAELEAELGIPREGWEARRRHSGRLWVRRIGALRAGQLNVYALLRAINPATAPGIAEQLNSLRETPHAVDPALVLAIAWREAGRNALPGRGTVNSLTGGGLDNLFPQQATRAQCRTLHAGLDAMIATAERLLADPAALRAQMEASGATESATEMEADLRRLLPVYRRYRRSPCGELRARDMLPDDFPQLNLALPPGGRGLFTPNERGPQLPAMLPRDVALEAYGAVIALARDRFLVHAERLTSIAAAEIEAQLPLRAMRFWTMVFFGGTGWGQQVLEWWLRNGGDLAMIPYAPAPGRLGRGLPDDVPPITPFAVARGLVTVMEAELIDQFLWPSGAGSAASTGPVASAPAEAPGEEAEAAAPAATASAPPPVAVESRPRQFTEYYVVVPDADGHPLRTAGVVSVWRSATVPAAELFELYRAGDEFLYNRGDRWIHVPGLGERYPEVREGR